MVAKKASLYDRADKKLQRYAGTVGAVVVLFGAITGVIGWLNAQIQDAISSQVNDLKQTMQTSDAQQNQQITRLELMELMNNQPTNVAEIEKVAKHYFQELGGNWYMTNLYSKWCAEYGGDPSIAVGGK